MVTLFESSPWMCMRWRYGSATFSGLEPYGAWNFWIHELRWMRRNRKVMDSWSLDCGGYVNFWGGRQCINKWIRIHCMLKKYGSVGNLGMKSCERYKMMDPFVLLYVDLLKPLSILDLYYLIDSYSMSTFVLHIFTLDDEPWPCDTILTYEHRTNLDCISNEIHKTLGIKTLTPL